MRKALLFLSVGCIALFNVSSVFAVAGTPTFGASVVSAPSTLQIGKTALYKFSVTNTSAVDSTGDISGCSFTAVYSTSQSAPGLAASGTVTVNGSSKPVTGDYGSAGMLGLYFDPLNIPAGQTAQFALTIGVASGVPAGSTMETAVMCSPANVTTTKYIAINAAPAPSLSPSAVASTPKVTVSAATQKPASPTTTTAPSTTPLTTISFAPTSIVLPSSYTKEGSRTTDLSKLTAEQLKSVEKLTLEVVGVSMVEFNEPVDLSGVTTKMNQLETYVRMNMVGDVFIDSELLAVLNKPAKITMKGLKFKNTPKIYKDDKPAGDAVSNVSYDSKTGVLTFAVSGFSRYTVVSADESGLSSNSLYVVGALAVISLFVGGLWFATKEGKMGNTAKTAPKGDGTAKGPNDTESPKV